MHANKYFFAQNYALNKLNQASIQTIASYKSLD